MGLVNGLCPRLHTKAGYEKGPSNYVKVIRIIVKKTILEILLGLAVLGLGGARGRAVVVDGYWRQSLVIEQISENC